MAIHAYNPNTPEAQTGGVPHVWVAQLMPGQPVLQSKILSQNQFINQNKNRQLFTLMYFIKN